MPNGMYGGVRGRKTKVGRKLSFSSYSIFQRGGGSVLAGLSQEFPLLCDYYEKKQTGSRMSQSVFSEYENVFLVLEHLAACKNLLMLLIECGLFSCTDSCVTHDGSN